MSRNHPDTMDYINMTFTARVEHLPEAERAVVIAQRVNATVFVKRWALRVGVEQAEYHEILECLGLRPYAEVQRPKKFG